MAEKRATAKIQIVNLRFLFILNSLTHPTKMLGRLDGLFDRLLLEHTRDDAAQTANSGLKNDCGRSVVGVGRGKGPKVLDQKMQDENSVIRY